MSVPCPEILCGREPLSSNQDGLALSVSRLPDSTAPFCFCIDDLLSCHLLWSFSSSSFLDSVAVLRERDGVCDPSTSPVTTLLLVRVFCLKGRRKRDESERELRLEEGER